MPTPSNQWYVLKVVIRGKRIEGYRNNRKHIDHAWKEGIYGEIGLWSKADSYAFFDNFTVKAK